MVDCMKPPLRVMITSNIRDTRSAAGAQLRRIEGKITTLPGGVYAVAGVSGLFRSKADALAAARKLIT